MTRFKDFDAARSTAAGEPVQFALAGTTFTTVDEIPASALLDFASAVATKDSPLDSMAAFDGILRSIVVTEEADAFRDALGQVGIRTALEVMNWVIEESTGRPLPNAADSPPSPSPAGEPSLVVSLSPIETRSA